MTCIAGVVSGGKVWLGGDSAGLAGWTLTIRADEKVFKKGPFVVGFTSSFRMGDLIRYALKPPEQTGTQGDREYLVTSFMDALRACLAAGGFKKVENGVDTGGEFLIGYRGRLYKVAQDFQVGEFSNDYGACGCGESMALGALFASKRLAPAARVRLALEAAEHHSGGVSGPFKIISGAT